jgi:hypothetical protein
LVISTAQMGLTAHLFRPYVNVRRLYVKSST